QKYQLGLNPLVADTDGQEIHDNTDPTKRKNTSAPLIALTTVAAVESGNQVTIQLTARGGAGRYTFSTLQRDPEMGSVGALGSVSADGSVTFSASNTANHDIWFDYHVLDAYGAIAYETVTISVSPAPR